MICFLFLFFYISTSSSSSILPSTNCTYTQQEATKCFLTRFDTDHNGGVSAVELTDALSTSPLIWVRAVRWIPGIVEKLYRDCDYDHNGQITAHDIYMMQDTCFVDRHIQCVLKKICNNNNNNK